MEVLLDSSFIISCVTKKIDFIRELELLGFGKVVVPRGVFEEIKDLRDKGNHSSRVAASIALEIMDNRGVKKKSLGKRKVDVGLIEEGKKGIYIASLDREIKRNSLNRVVINSAKNNLEIERD